MLVRLPPQEQIFSSHPLADPPPRTTAPPSVANPTCLGLLFPFSHLRTRTSTDFSHRKRFVNHLLSGRNALASARLAPSSSSTAQVETLLSDMLRSGRAIVAKHVADVAPERPQRSLCICMMLTRESQANAQVKPHQSTWQKHRWQVLSQTPFRKTCLEILRHRI